MIEHETGELGLTPRSGEEGQKEGEHGERCTSYRAGGGRVNLEGEARSLDDCSDSWEEGPS